MKPDPVTAMVLPGAPTIMVDGARAVSTGVAVGVLTRMLPGFEVPPPGAELTAVTESLPTIACSTTESGNVSCVPLTIVGVCAVVPTCTVVPEIKLFPVSVIVVGVVLPAGTAAGESDEIVGSGLFTDNDDAAELPPPGAPLTAVNVSVPAPARSAALRTILTCVPLT